MPGIAKDRLSPAGPGQGDLGLGGRWARLARAAASERFAASGLPARRDEYWKFTRPDALIDTETPRADLLDADASFLPADQDALRIVFVDGALDASRSDALELLNVEIEPLETAIQSDVHWLQDIYGRIEAEGQQPIARPLAARNTATATRGMVLKVSGKAPRPVAFIYERQNAQADVTLHHVIRVESGGDLTLLESGPVAARLNMVTEIDIAENGALHHVRVQGRDHQRVAATHIFARLGKSSEYKSFSLTVNGALTRNEHVVRLCGEQAHATVSGACVGDGAFHQDDTVFVTHDAPDCESRQVFKKVLRNGAVGVFQGKILVNQVAQKTDGYQISQGLLMDGDSQFLAKPELEIYADDVACSHGATVGAIDEEALFYLTSRGIPHPQAQDLLVLAFLSQALEEIDSEDIRAELHRRLEAWIERHHV